MQPMVVDKRTAKLAFARRLNAALLAAGIPDDEKRRGWVSRTFGVSVEAARKWLVGESMPDTARIEGIATELGCSVNELLNGAPKGSHATSYVKEPTVDYLASWMHAEHNKQLFEALRQAHQTGVLTPTLADGITAMLHSMNK